jgi:hypothetical protein
MAAGMDYFLLAVQKAFGISDLRFVVYNVEHEVRGCLSRIRSFSQVQLRKMGSICENMPQFMGQYKVTDKK